MEEGVQIVEFTSYMESVHEVFSRLKAEKIPALREQIIIKPNLTNDSPPPVTTPVECCRAVLEYVRRLSPGRVIIAEGCGAADMETQEVFECLGYDELARDFNVELLDLNRAPLATMSREDCDIFPQIHLPEIISESYIISLPVLKAHSLAQITGTLKNMMGFAPPSHYQCGGHWKKSAFHQNVHGSIAELNRYLTPHLTLLDARVGLAEYHLGGAECSPPVGKLVGGYDPVAVDRTAAGLLGLDWRRIPHIAG